MESQTKLTFQETDGAGNPTATFVYSEQGGSSKRVGRVDAIVSTCVLILSPLSQEHEFLCEQSKFLSTWPFYECQMRDSSRSTVRRRVSLPVNTSQRLFTASLESTLDCLLGISALMDINYSILAFASEFKIVQSLEQ